MRALILLAISSGASMASAECRLMADLHQVPVEVEIPGRAPIELTFRSEQLVELLPGDSSDGVRFRTIGPVELVARLPSDRPVIIAVQRPSVRSGPIQLHDGALVRVERVTDAGLFGFVRIAAGVTARVGPLSCAGLRVITGAELSDSGGFPPEDAPTHVDARLAGPRLRLYRDGVAALVHVREPLEVARLERRGRRFRVRRDFTSGITLEGWVPAADVTSMERRALDLEPHFRGLTLRSTGSGSCGRDRPLRVRPGSSPWFETGRMVPLGPPSIPTRRCGHCQ